MATNSGLNRHFPYDHRFGDGFEYAGPPSVVLEHFQPEWKRNAVLKML
jgi:hypothetical protein